MRSASTLGCARSTSTARCRSLISWNCSALSAVVNRTGDPLRRLKGTSIAITTAPFCAEYCARAVMSRASLGMPCMTTMPGRGPERMTGSHISPVTNPPSGLLKEIWPTSTPFIPD